MAGFTYNGSTHKEYQFHIGDSNIAHNIREANKRPTGKKTHVITLQLDGDELDAALWGLENYQKNAVVYVVHDPGCKCQNCSKGKTAHHG